MPPPCWVYYSKLGHRFSLESLPLCVALGLLISSLSKEMPVRLDPPLQYVRDCLLHSWSYLVERYYFVKIAIIEA
ncbi:unnamed protein product [Arabidopsis lyrata]|nr:unnamed protein product [Arabidopsis lyrata]